jgi:hypothetical protein
MHKEYFRLSEEVGTNSEFYSDDEEASKLADSLRDEYSNLEDSTTPSSPKTDEDYDDLFNQI